jgi:pilus assembly protein CpaD
MSKKPNFLALQAARGAASGSGLRRTAILMLAGCALMTGCASYDRNHFTVGSVPDDYRTRHPIVVSQSDITEDIVVSQNSREISYRDRGAVNAFGSKFMQSGAAEMGILVPAGSPNEAAARRIAHQAKQVLVERGIPASRITIHSYSAAGHGDSATLRLVYTGVTAKVEGACGQWNEDIADTTENRNYANFGCATQQNLAAMVANPSDLLGPRGESEIDATRRTIVIDDWRTEGSRPLNPLFAD